MLIPIGDCLGLITGHILIHHIVHEETSLWCCGGSPAVRNCSAQIHNGEKARKYTAVGQELKVGHLLERLMPLQYVGLILKPLVGEGH